MPDLYFIDRLTEKGLINANAAARIKNESASSGVPVDKILESRGIAPGEILAAKSETYGVPVYELKGQKVDVEVLKFLPEESARLYQFAPLGVKDGVLEIGMFDPANIEAREAIKFIASKTNIPFKIYVISGADLETVLEEYKSLGGEVSG